MPCRRAHSPRPRKPMAAGHWRPITRRRWMARLCLVAAGLAVPAWSGGLPAFARLPPRPQKARRTQSAVSGSRRTLRAPSFERRCSCDASLQEGYDLQSGVCMKGLSTSCDECSNQAKCAQVNTFAGDGLKTYEGECKYYPTNMHGCVTADQASLSFPGGLDIDQFGNTFIADYENNRVRIVYADTQVIATIAGTGHVGFSGDGGLGRLATLRNPDGIAVRPNSALTANQYGNEVWFSDSRNERVRKVRFEREGWIITTMIGTGYRGGGQECRLCDPACHPLEAKLYHPRGMAFSSTQDFYFVDSGNYQIRRVWGDVDSWNYTNMCTLLGKKPSVNQNSNSAYKPYEGRLLAGHLATPNEHTHPTVLIKLQIDRNDNLWWTDYSDNRMYMTPLNNFTFGNIGGFVGIYVNSYLAHFLTSPQDKQAMEDNIKDALQVWLPREGIFVEIQDSTVVVREPGSSYWVFATPARSANSGIEQSKWCDRVGRDRRNCQPSTVQQIGFNRIMGTCFDVANNMYLVDPKNSEVVYVYHDDSTTHSVITTAQEEAGTARKVSTDGCPCLRMWVEAALEGLPDDWVAHNCVPSGWELGDGEVPGAKATELQEDGLLTVRYPDNHPRAGELVRCTVEDYCGAPYGDSVEWCYHDSAATTGPLDQCNRVGVVGVWGYCAREGHGITWNEKIGPPDFPTGAALLGNELRLEKRWFATSDMLLDMQLNLTADHSLRRSWAWTTPARSMIKWSQLIGFEPPASSACGCCGLQEMPDWYESGGGAGTGGDGANSTVVCLLIPNLTLSDPLNMTQDEYVQFTTEPLVWMVEKYGITPIPTTTTTTTNLLATDTTTTTTTMTTTVFVLREVKLVWMELSAVELDEEGGTMIRECQDRCGLNKLCKAVAVMCNEDPLTGSYEECRQEQDGELCVLFGETWPYYMYELRETVNRSRVSDSSYVDDMVDAFSGAVKPLSMFFSNDLQTGSARTTQRVHVGSSFWPASALPRGSATGDESSGVPRLHPTTLSGPHREAALNTDDCKQLCVLKPLCTAIAFPGCYLTTLTGLVSMEPHKTAVYVKTYGSHKVRGVAGHKAVYAFAGDGGDIQNVFMNRPSECVVSEGGEVFFTDSWNHRVRKISNIHHNCQYVKSQKISLVDIETYIDALAIVERNCSASPEAVVRSHYERAQNGVFSADLPINERMSNLNQSMCNLPGAMDAPKNLPTSNMLVLCEICAYIRDNLDDHERPDSNSGVGETYNVCPMREMCYCRSAVVAAFQTKVYLNCPMQHAYYDEWHRWLTSFISCYLNYNAEDVQYQTVPDTRCMLIEQIRVLENQPRSDNSTYIRGDPCRCNYNSTETLPSDSADHSCTTTAPPLSRTTTTTA